MKPTITAILLVVLSVTAKAQQLDTLLLRHVLSQNDTMVYTRVVRFDQSDSLYHVQDFFPSGQIQMQATYSSFDRTIKEQYQCNYRTNTKEGPYKEWFDNGRVAFEGNFQNGVRHGVCRAWYRNGQQEEESHWLNGQLNGRTEYWTEKGDLQFDLQFDHGVNQHPRDTSYRYLSYLPPGYDQDTITRWPLIIYLHGGSSRGSQLKKLYASGIPDQIYRGRKFPFVIAAPQCPEHIRWSTDNWFERFYREITSKYRIDTNRIYLTGVSLGGSGTWYLAVRYPERFAAIAPMSGFTSHMDFIDKNIDRLADMPIWAFHGRMDLVVPVEETERMVRKLEEKNRNLKVTIDPDIGHWIDWLVYPKDELYQWFLRHDKRQEKRD